MPPEGQRYRALVAWTRRQRNPWQRRQIDAMGMNQKLASYYVRRLVDDGHAARIGYALYESRKASK